MYKTEKARPTLRSVRKQLFLMTVGFVALIIAVVAIVTTLIFAKTDSLLKSKVISLTSSLNVQMKLNLDSYLSRMETVGTLAFGVKDAYTYDASDPDNDEYEALNTEKDITDELNKLCIMDNFVDYGIVYRNNRTVGKISNGTTNLLGEDMFDKLSAMITRQRTKDGWAAGYLGNFKRIYYVKRVHENALIVLSFYTSELEAVFDNPETLGDMDIRLVNSDYNILYSARKDETGERLNDDILSRVKGKASASVMDDYYLVTVNSCGDDWYVICSIPTEIILAENNEMRIFIIIIALIAALTAAGLGMFISAKLTSPVKRAVSLLDVKATTDQLTGILNKQSFNERTAGRLDPKLGSESHALILLDLDNFKGVNDTLGHVYGDKVLAKTGSILKSEFTTEDYLGRIGGDEFCVLVNSTPPEGQDYISYITERCEALKTAFTGLYTGDDSNYKISASIGVSLFPKDGTTFDELYVASDKALYRSKKAGKDTYMFYDRTKDSEVNG